MVTEKVKHIRIGTGAGYSGDRIEPAVELAEKGQIQYLVFECLAERTIALAQQLKTKDPEAGFDPLLEKRMRACLPLCKQNKIKIVSNMGAANPRGAMEKTVEVARQLGLKNLTIACVTGDDVYDIIREKDLIMLESGHPMSTIKDQIISANAYLGAQPIVEALKLGADIILTGRVADPALFIAPLAYEFNWSFSDYERLGQGVVLGHLLECAGQVTGGYFADPGLKDVPQLSRLGFPIAEVESDGTFIITKVQEAGGMVTAATCKEQLLYEIHDPAYYLTPDVIADFTKVRITQTGKDQVKVTGGTGREKTGLLKVSVGYKDGFIGEGQISYGGPGAVQRAQLAATVIQQRFDDLHLDLRESRFDLIGMNSLYGDKISAGEPFEVRLRVAARTSSREDAMIIGNEVEALYTNGPSGGGGVVKSVREVIAIQSVLLEAHWVKPMIHLKTI